MCPCRSNIKLIVSTDRLDISFVSLFCVCWVSFSYRMIEIDVCMPVAHVSSTQGECQFLIFTCAFEI